MSPPKGALLRFEKIKRFDFVYSSSNRLVFISFVFGYVIKAAVKDFAKLIKSICVHILVFSQPVKLPCAYMIFFYQLVLRYSFFLHGHPEPVKNNHFNTALFKNSIKSCLLLDNSPYTGYNVRAGLTSQTLFYESKEELL